MRTNDLWKIVFKLTAWLSLKNAVLEQEDLRFDFHHFEIDTTSGMMPKERYLCYQVV